MNPFWLFILLLGLSAEGSKCFQQRRRSFFPPSLSRRNGGNDSGVGGKSSNRNTSQRNLLPVDSLLGRQSTISSIRGGSTSVSTPHTTTGGMDQQQQQHFRSVMTALFAQDPAESREPLKVLFLSADTGGGHRASAESLANQFVVHYPGTQYDLLDIWTTDGILPYRTLVPTYKHLSAHPRQWRFLYHLSNSRPWELGMDFHSTLMCERKIRKRIESYNPDVIVSVHPAMNNTPLIATRKISKKLGKHIPFFTVVTDLGSGHCTWFQKNVDKMYLASDRLRRLAKRRGRIADDKIVMTGLPIRRDFAVQAEQLGDRTTPDGQAYVKQMKQTLGLNSDRPMILVMGGGEGVGSLSTIVLEMYTSFMRHGVDATICVVCGRNEKLQNELATKDWDNIVKNRKQTLRKRSRIPFFGRRKNLKIMQSARSSTSNSQSSSRGGVNIQVVGLGFITNMADYMVAADVLVTKAGPGTIAEAAAVGLPVMLTSFLPGQEAGNVDYVLEYGFGEYYEDPVIIAEQVSVWLQNPNTLIEMSHKSRDVGQPKAAEEIVLDIGSLSHTWKALNEST